MSACLRPDEIDPPGTYRLYGRLWVRRFAPVKPFNLTCRLGHKMRVSHRPLTSTPQCDYHYRPDNQQCLAHLYIYKVSRLRYQMLDITRQEAEMIESERMDYDDVIAHFGLDLTAAA